MEWNGIFANRRLTENFVYERLTENTTLKKMPLKEQKKKKYRMVHQEYNFLQFVPIARVWAQRNFDLSLGEFEMLLYLYPVSVFTRSQFHRMLKEIGRGDYTLMKSLKEKGMISLWAEDGGEKIYTLSNKANDLMTRLHRMCMLEEKIPMSERRNVIVRSNEQTDKELTELFRAFNKKVTKK
jgi:hypothetical protein